MLWRDSFTIDYVEAFAVRAMFRLRDIGKRVNAIAINTESPTIFHRRLIWVTQRYSTRAGVKRQQQTAKYQ